MISSLFYGVCFLIVLLNPSIRIKIMAGICLAYIVIENLILWYTVTNVVNFDITLYHTFGWILDSTLLFAVGCVLRGRRQILIISSAIPLMVSQVLAIQYPSLFSPTIYQWIVENAHMYFIEMFIFAHAWKDNTIKEWLKTGTVLGLVVAAHLV
ncbi:hypothetical protein [Salmonella phage SSBI34]|nr:hypothetical protein [Salmonella phage SSBI34]